VQGRLYRSLKLWSFYCDLEESLGTLESTRAVYDAILELRIATPQIILNYALYLQVQTDMQTYWLTDWLTD
jgi:pre-mRNA-splicing factor SYF1